MSSRLPVPVRSERPDVIVMDSRASRSREMSALGRLLVSLTPDLIRVLERSIARRQTAPDAASVTSVTRADARLVRGGVQLSEIEYETSMPFLRKITVRKASAWSSDVPFVAPHQVAAPRSSGGRKLRRAGIASLGGAFVLAAAGLLASRAGNIIGLGSRRGF